jgi:hypothetical protein
MRARCNNPRTHAYDRYGGRGIKTCQRWNSFEKFLADMGEPPEGHTLDRINNDRGYEPGNVRWATPLQQVHNRRPFKRRRAKVEELTRYTASLARAAVSQQNRSDHHD